jgi:hypothetical protein
MTKLDEMLTSLQVKSIASLREEVEYEFHYQLPAVPADWETTVRWGARLAGKRAVKVVQDCRLRDSVEAVFAAYFGVEL